MPKIMIENPNEKIVKAIRGMMEKNGGYCPCVPERNENTKCPCLKYRLYQECCCNLFVVAM